jgi:hypothetical protein
MIRQSLGVEDLISRGITGAVELAKVNLDLGKNLLNFKH